MYTKLPFDDSCSLLNRHPNESTVEHLARITNVLKDLEDKFVGKYVHWEVKPSITNIVKILSIDINDIDERFYINAKAVAVIQEENYLSYIYKNFKINPKTLSIDGEDAPLIINKKFVEDMIKSLFDNQKSKAMNFMLHSRL